ncbi:MAG: hypothetical protein ACTSO6_08240, partial [Promethearchaeota archaeon]
MDINERIANIEISMESQKSVMGYYLSNILENNGYQDTVDLAGNFFLELDKLRNKHEKEDTTDLTRFYRLIMMVKPALNTILKVGKVYDEVCDAMVGGFNIILNRVRNQVNDR